MYILERLLAIFLGVTVLPLRILAFNALYALLAILLGVVATFGLPIILASVFNDMGISKTKNILINTFFIFPLFGAIAASAIVTAVAYLAYDTVINGFKSMFYGIKNGFFDGMDGFRQALASQHSVIQDIDVYMRAFEAGVNPNELINDVDFDGFQRVRGELQDVVVVHEDLEVPDLESRGPKTAPLFSDKQIETINKIIAELAQSKESLSSRVKSQLEDLQIVFSQYKELWKKLEEVRSALRDKDKTRITDEMIAYNEVETPILLVKQYKQGEKWHNVPANSYVTDKQSLLQWLKTNPKHPLNKDLLKHPEPYDTKETRYIWYELTQDNCSSQELGEAAERINILIKHLLPILTTQQRSNLGLGSNPFSFFSIKEATLDSTAMTLEDGRSLLNSSP